MDGLMEASNQPEDLVFTVNKVSGLSIDQLDFQALLTGRLRCKKCYSQDLDLFSIFEEEKLFFSVNFKSPCLVFFATHCMAKIMKSQLVFSSGNPDFLVEFSMFEVGSIPCQRVTESPFTRAANRRNPLRSGNQGELNNKQPVIGDWSICRSSVTVVPF